MNSYFSKFVYNLEQLYPSVRHKKYWGHYKKILDICSGFFVGDLEGVHVESQVSEANADPKERSDAGPPGSLYKDC